MVNSLDKKWKEFLFAFSGFGPNLLMILMGSYYQEALHPGSLESGEQFQAILPGVCFILPAIFPLLYGLGKAFDGIIDIPLAHLTDTLSTKWGRRRPAIAVCFLPMVISYILCWIPIGGPEGQLFNTIWCTVWCMVFFAAYTMCLIAFYGSLSTVCIDEPQRLRVSGYKSFFDTITYCLIYALVPVILSGTKLHIDKLVFMLIPVMLTMLIPLFMIKEGEKYGYPERRGMVEERISIKESISLTFKNPVFRMWLIVNSCTFFGLNMFLSAMNGMIIGSMGLTGFHMTILNTAAFAPVPIMLYLFNKVKAKRGVRFTYQTCLLAFAVAIMTFFIGSRFMMGEGNYTPKIVIGLIGGICASWSIGAFFMMPYLAPSQISSVEERLTGKNHSAMYFAGNAVVTSIAGAISGNLIYDYLKNVYITQDLRFAWAEVPAVAYEKLFGGATVVDGTLVADQAAKVFNFGNLIVPFIVCITCVIGYFIAFKLPKDFSPAILAREFKKADPSLDISEIEAEEVKTEKGEIIFVQIGLSILSGFIFGFVWLGFILKSMKEFFGKYNRAATYLLSALVPFASIFFLLKMRRELVEEGKKRGAELKINAFLLVAPAVIFPILPVNVISMAILQHNINKLYAAE